MTASNDLLSVDRVRALVADPQAVEGADLAGLRAWRDRFPYAPVFSILVAKAAAEAGSVDQQAELLRAAANAASREGLFELFVRPSLVEEARQIAAEIAELPIPVEAPVPPAEPDSPPAEPDDVGREVLLAAIESSLAQDVDAWQAEQPKPEPVAPPASGGNLSPFAAWLQMRASGTGFGESAGGQAPVEAPTPQGQSALIDAFIAASPRIGKMRDVGGEVEDLARQSVLEDATLVTETMARVYAKQGQIGKARKAYKLLALKYPAKSTYFAAQLKQLGKSTSGGDS